MTCFGDPSTSLGSLVQHIRTYAMATISAEQFCGGARRWGLSMLVRSCRALRQASSYEDNAQGSPGRNAQIRMPKRRTAGLCACGNAGDARERLSGA